MAQSIALFLKANGNKIDGDSTIHSLEREGSIECLSFKDSVRTARDKATGMATGRRTYEPILFTKHIDRATPQIAQALCNNEVIEAEFKFFRPSPKGDGKTEQFFTIKLTDARISSIERTSPDAWDPAQSNLPPMETIGIVFGEVTWTHNPGKKEHTDSWVKQD